MIIAAIGLGMVLYAIGSVHKDNGLERFGTAMFAVGLLAFLLGK